MSPSNNDRAKLTKNKKTYAATQVLGQVLRARREELKLDLARVERDTKIRRKYLEYIESSNYARLRDDVYSLGYVKNYADYLGLETTPILLMYKKERTSRAQNLKSRGGTQTARIGLTPIISPRLIITPRTFVAVCVAGIVAVIIGYLIWQLSSLSAAPKITLDNPDRETVTSAIVFVGGHVDGGADVLINDSPILTDSNGAFRERVSLVQGVNQIRVTAHNKLGKSAGVSKVFVANLPTDKNQPDTNSVKFDGVSLKVSVHGGASWIIVSADDVEIYRGTMLDNSTQTFQAADHLKVSVGNGGNVAATLTNNKVVNKDLGTLGNSGETKRDLEFNKDTQTL